MTVKKVMLLLSVSVVLLIAGCGDSSSTSGEKSAAPPDAATAKSAVDSLPKSMPPAEKAKIEDSIRKSQAH